LNALYGRNEQYVNPRLRVYSETSDRLWSSAPGFGSAHCISTELRIIVRMHYSVSNLVLQNTEQITQEEKMQM